MVRPASFLALALNASLIAQTVAHPGEHHDESEVQQEIVKRTTHANHIARGLANCAGNQKYHALQARAAERRFQKAQDLRRKRELPVDRPFKTRRDLTAIETFEAENHNYTSSGYSTSSDASSLFANYKNVSCILTPEVTYGPYYVSGELIRSNVVDGQEGVPVHLEYQYIDVSTCGAVSGLYVDTWQANATGVYSGVVASGNGNEADTTNLNSTALRGMQPTDTDGVAAFDTLFVGHYSGRASHIHLLAHHGGTVLANGTYQGGNISHVGQLFFQEELKNAVEATYPYNTNTQAITTNDEDMWAPAQADNSYDPFPEYAHLGDSIEDGLLMWISIGVDLSSDYAVEIAAAYTANGGVASTSNSLGSGSGSGVNGTASGNMTMPAGGNATAPTGAMGAAPSGQMSGTASLSFAGTSVLAGTTGASTSMASTSLTISSLATSSSSSSSATTKLSSFSTSITKATVSSSTSSVNAAHSSAVKLSSSVRSSSDISSSRSTTSISPSLLHASAPRSRSSQSSLASHPSQSCTSRSDHPSPHPTDGSAGPSGHSVSSMSNEPGHSKFMPTKIPSGPFTLSSDSYANSAQSYQAQWSQATSQQHMGQSFSTVVAPSAKMATTQRSGH